MAVHATLDRRSGARPRFFVLSRPQWILGFLVLLLAALGAWQALPLERARREGEPDPDEAGPALGLLTPAPDDPAAPAAPPQVAVTPVRAYPLPEFRPERERLRSRQMDLLQAIVGDAAASEERRRDAQQRLLALWEAEAREAQIEN